MRHTAVDVPQGVCYGQTNITFILLLISNRRTWNGAMIR